MSINKVTLVGNLTRDAELSMLPSGSPVLNFSIAVNDRVRNGDEWKDYANFFDCSVFGNRATAIQQYLTKGLKVAVEGHLHWSQWDDKETGKKRSRIQVYVDNVEFMSRGGATNDATPAAPAAPAAPAVAPAAAPAQDYEDDVPF